MSWPSRCRVLRDLMHLRDRHEHPIAPGVTQIEIILSCAEDRFGTQTEILADAVHGVHDVIADAQIGERDRNAFLDGANLDALGRRAEDFAIAEHAQSQAGNPEARFDRAMIDEHAAASAASDPRCPQRATDRTVRETAALTMYTRFAACRSIRASRRRRARFDD